MGTPKDQIAALVNEQPEDSTYDEILREIAFNRMVEKGLDDARSGRMVSNEDAARRIRTWQK